MWFSQPNDGECVRVFIFREDIDEIRSGFNPDDWDGCCSVVIKKNEEEVWILEDEHEIDIILENERRKETIYLHS